MLRDGVRSRYVVDGDSPTTVVGVAVPPSKQRSLVFTTGAPSKAFCEQYAARFLDSETRRLLLCGRVLYSAAWMAFVSMPLVQHAADEFLAEAPRDTRTFAYNLASEMLMREPHRAAQLATLARAGLIFGNESEFRALADLWPQLPPDAPLAHVVRRVATLGRHGRAWAVCTCGADDTLVSDGDSDAPVQRFPVLAIASSAIVDTTGAGDAFVGGFLCAWARQRCVFAPRCPRD